MSLPLKTSAQVLFTGNDLGGQLNVQLADIGLTGSNNAPLTPNLKSGTIMSKGILAYSSINQLKSSQTFVTTDYDAGRVTMIFTIQNVIVGVFTSKTGTFTSAFVPTATWLKFSASTNGLNALELLKTIESLGGYEGYQAHIAKSNITSAFGALSIKDSPSTDGWQEDHLYLSYNCFAPFGAGTIYMSSLDPDLVPYEGKGEFWSGPPSTQQGEVPSSEFRFVDWKTLTSTPTKFVVKVGPRWETAEIAFTIDDEPVGILTIEGTQAAADLIGSSGIVTWRSKVGPAQSEPTPETE